MANFSWLGAPRKHDIWRQCLKLCPCFRWTSIGAAEKRQEIRNRSTSCCCNLRRSRALDYGLKLSETAAGSHWLLQLDPDNELNVLQESIRCRKVSVLYRSELQKQRDASSLTHDLNQQSNYHENAAADRFCHRCWRCSFQPWTVGAGRL